jgi:hypothetical protein
VKKLFAAVLILLVAACANGQLDLPRPNDPQTYTSPSKRFAVRLIATAPIRNCSTQCRFYRNGRMMWSKTYPFCLEGAAVSDSGRFGGYSNEGPQAIVWIFAADGSIISSYAKTRVGTVPDGLSFPNFTEIAVEADALIVDAGAPYGDETHIWHFSLTTGKLTADTKGDDPRLPRRDWSIPPGEPMKLSARQVQPAQIFEIPVTHSPAIKDIGDLELLPNNRLVFLRGGFHPAVVVMGRDGQQPHEVALPVGVRQRSEARELVLFRDEKCVVFDWSGPEENSLKTWRIDLKRMTLEAGSPYKFAQARKLVVLPNGNLVAFIWNPPSYDSVLCFSPSGAQIWNLKSQQSFDHTRGVFTSPNDMASDENSNLAVLDNEGPKVQLFDANGKYKATLDLKSKWKAEGGQYAGGIVSDARGGWIVTDYPKCFRVSASGNVTEFGAGVFNDHSPVPSGMRVESSGDTWTSNDKQIFHLDPEERLLATIGSKSSAEGFSEVSTVLVTGWGTFLAFDNLQSRLHEFRAFRESRSISCPVPAVPADATTLHSAPSGDVYINRSRNSLTGQKDPPTLRVSPSFHLASIENNIRIRSWRHVPTYWFWDKNALTDGGTAKRELQWWPNGDWLMVTISSVTPNGDEFALEDWPFRRDQRRHRMAVFSRAGKPRWMGWLPTSVGWITSAVCDGRFVYAMTGSAMIVLTKSGTPLYQMDLPVSGEHASIFAIRGGFALFDGEKKIYWYKIKA